MNPRWVSINTFLFYIIIFMGFTFYPYLGLIRNLLIHALIFLEVNVSISSAISNIWGHHCAGFFGWFMLHYFFAALHQIVVI